MRSTKFRRPRRWLVAAAAAVALLGSAAAVPSYAAANRRPRPTVVLVHGAWADSSSWHGVVRRLQHDGYAVDVFATPLRSLSGDSAALRMLLRSISGPVVLVGHSYGGAVVTNAATGEANVKALVYVDAFAPAQGQAVLALPGAGSALAAADPTTVFRLVPPTLPPTAETDFYVLPDVFVSSFANDLPRRTARVLALTQRAVTLAALSEPSGEPAWASIPTWYEVGTLDKVITPQAQRQMAATAGAHVSTARTGHLPMVSAPKTVARLIERAAAATR